MKKFLHVFFAFALVFTTTGSIWQHVLDHVDDPVELSSEQETEKENSEKENKTETSGDDHITSEQFSFAHQILLEQKKQNTSGTSPISKDADRLYILLHRLKVDC